MTPPLPRICAGIGTRNPVEGRRGENKIEKNKRCSSDTIERFLGMLQIHTRILRAFRSFVAVGPCRVEGGIRFAADGVQRALCAYVQYSVRLRRLPEWRVSRCLDVGC